MVYQRRYARAAAKHYQEITRLTKSQYPSTGTLWLQRLKLKLARLSDHPFMGEPYGRFRRVLHDPYYVYYEVHVQTGIVEILAIWHCAVWHQNSNNHLWCNTHKAILFKACLCTFAAAALVFVSWKKLTISLPAELFEFGFCPLLRR